MPPAPPIDAVRYLSERAKRKVDAQTEHPHVYAWLLIAKKQSTFRRRTPKCRKCAARKWPCIDPREPGAQRRCEGCYRTGSRCVQPYPGEAPSPAGPAPSILQAIDAGGSEAEAMDAEEYGAEDEITPLEAEERHEYDPMDVEAEQFWQAANVNTNIPEPPEDTDSDSDIEFVSMTAPGPTPWMPTPTRPLPLREPTPQPTPAPPAQSTSQMTPPPTPPPPSPPTQCASTRQPETQHWTDEDVERVLAAAEEQADPIVLVLFNGEVKSLRGKRYIINVVPEQEGLAWHVGVCDRELRKTILICVQGVGDARVMLQHAQALFRAMNLESSRVRTIKLDPAANAAGGALWTTTVAQWLAQCTPVSLCRARRLHAVQRIVLERVNAVVRSGEAGGGSAASQTVREDAGQMPETPTLRQAQAPAPHPIPPPAPARLRDDPVTGAAATTGVSTHRFALILSAAEATADKRCLVIYDGEQKFLRGAELVVLIFPPRDGLPWHLGVCNRVLKKTRLVCVAGVQGFSGLPFDWELAAMASHVKEAFLAFRSLRCDMEDFATIQLSPDLAAVSGGLWTSVLAIWLTRERPELRRFAPMKHLRIVEEHVASDMDLILAGQDWTGNCMSVKKTEDERERKAERKREKEKRREEARLQAEKEERRAERRDGEQAQRVDRSGPEGEGSKPPEDEHRLMSGDDDAQRLAAPEGNTGHSLRSARSQVIHL